MAQIRINKNEATAARRRVFFHLVDATDGITPETGEADGQPQLSVDGGAWADTGIGTLVAIGHGRYYAELTQAVVNADNGVFETRYKSAATAECPGDTAIIDYKIEQAALANTVAPDNASIAAILVDTGTDGVKVADKTGYSLAADQSAVTVGTVNTLATGALTAIANAVRDLATYGLSALHALLTSTGIKVATNADKTGYSGTATNMVDPAPTAAANATAVRAELATELGRLDAAVSTRNATPPDNASIAAILEDTGTTIPGALATITGYVDTEVAATLAAVDTEVAAVKAVTDKLDSAMEADGAIHRFTANALEQAPVSEGGGDAPTVEEISAQLERTGGTLATILEDTGTTLPAAIAEIEGSGSSDDLGPDTVTLTLADVLGNELAAARVYVSSDAAGLVRSPARLTDDTGRVRFGLIDGDSYYLWVFSDGFTGTNPTAFTAVAD